MIFDIQNLAWAAGYNILAIPAVVAGKVTLALAALLMALGPVSIVRNALRLSAGQPPAPRTLCRCPPTPSLG
ncbi:MAG: hypothetical protein NZX77_15965 [Polyangiaceae bacterium]|nr:hypothetical protein [Polyangiaceae bacterium]